MRAHRRSRGLSQEEFAEAIGHNRTYIGAIERGDRNLTLCTVERFAELLGEDPWVMMAPPEYFVVPTDLPVPTEESPGE